MGRAAHLRVHPRRPVLRAGLRRRAGPPVAARALAAHGRRLALGDRRRGGRGARHVRAAAPLSGGHGRGVAQLLAGRAADRGGVRPRHQCPGRPGRVAPGPAADRVRTNRDAAGALDAGDRDQPHGRLRHDAERPDRGAARATGAGDRRGARRDRHAARSARVHHRAGRSRSRGHHRRRAAARGGGGRAGALRGPPAGRRVARGANAVERPRGGPVPGTRVSRRGSARSAAHPATGGEPDRLHRDRPRSSAPTTGSCPAR